MNGHITLEGLLKLLRKNVHILIGWVVGCLAVTALFTFLVIEPDYQATSRIVVNQTENRASNITSTDINTNISLMNTYQSIMMEPIILEDVIQETNSDASLDQMRTKISFQNDSQSLVFGIVVTDKNPYTAADIANATAEVFQGKIGEILPVESVTILSEAVPNLAPISPNVVRNLFFGILLGALIGFVQVFMTALLDKRVKSREIISNLGWINLGTVNKMSDRELAEAILPKPEPNAVEETKVSGLSENKAEQASKRVDSKPTIEDSYINKVELKEGRHV